MKKCRVCPARFEPFNSTQIACSPGCAYKLVQANKQKKARKQQLADKQRIKSYAVKMKELQVVFNELRRMEEFAWFKERNIEPYCISCLKPLGNDQWCCGHFKTTKARPDLRFDKMNTYLQHNVRCNQMMSGDIEGYKLGLAYRFGDDEAKRIINHCDKVNSSYKLEDDQIALIKKQWRKKIRELKINC